MTNKHLNMLVQQGIIRNYEYVEVNEDGKVVDESNKKSKFRNTEQLILIFNNGYRLRIDTFCSGCAENTVLDIAFSDVLFSDEVI